MQTQREINVSTEKGAKTVSCFHECVVKCRKKISESGEILTGRSCTLCPPKYVVLVTNVQFLRGRMIWIEYGHSGNETIKQTNRPNDQKQYLPSWGWPWAKWWGYTEWRGKTAAPPWQGGCVTASLATGRLMATWSAISDEDKAKNVTMAPLWVFSGHRKLVIIST